ncbi:NHLP bacteriocin system secretion protein [Pleurocapsa sp. PCC 7319]|uniref:NHLP bacteriocin system secretion protein n=1 Tax=Pleurocapsa sp. PCC 7319 TaxID=118161 RepID=UPI00034943A3|nr:NHLP bacteriocin system secretion protein [Pleurocapsa sp. PCC 7319]
MSDKIVRLISSNSDKNSRSLKIRVLIVDDQNLVRQRLKLLIETEADLEVVGTAEDGEIAIEQIESLKPDVILLDLEMPRMNGIKVTRIISKRFPECRILILSSHETSEYIDRAIDAGARGYLLKNAPIEELNNAIHSVNRGYFHLAPGLWEKFHQNKSQTTLETPASKIQIKNSSTQSPPQESKLFRQKSLERLASPEKLDLLMRVVNPKSWLPLATLGSLILAAGIWSVYGKLPVTVEGRGVLIFPSKVVPLQAKSTGQLLELKIRPGDQVKKGEVIATIAQIDLRKQLELAQAKLIQLQNQDRDINLLQNQRQDRDLESISEQRQTLEQRLNILEELTPTLRDKGLVSIERDREAVKTRLKTLRELLPTFEQRLKTRKRLFDEGAISDDVLLQARQEYFDNTAQISEAESQLKQLDVKEADALKEYLSNLNEIKNIKAQLQELRSKKANLAQQDWENSNNRTKEIQETEREIARLSEQITDNSQIISQHNGKILEITTNLGQVVQPGNRIANIDIDNPRGKMVGITYFPVEDGKKIQPDMNIQITPQTIKRERFGGIIGEVKRISPFPITKEAAANIVGNPEVVEGLVSKDRPGLMQVSATLQSDANTYSGYRWSSSSGPNLKISPGTTTIARVKVEERSPISYVIPLLRSVSGIY